jgi:DNA-binding NarL/FixJ family response regulator
MSAQKVELDARDIAILQALADGNESDAIAAQHGICKGRVKNCVKSILDLLGADNRTQAVAMALRRGLIK